MVFHWSLRDSKSSQVSRTFFSILTVLNNAVLWMVSTRPPTSNSSNPFYNPLVTVPKAPIVIGIIITFRFHSFFNSLARSCYLSFFSTSFQFLSVLFGGQLVLQSPQFLQVLSLFFFFFLITIRSVFLPEIKRSDCVSKSHRSLCVSFTRTVTGLCMYHLFVWSNFNFLHISQWLPLPT